MQDGKGARNKQNQIVSEDDLKIRKRMGEKQTIDLGAVHEQQLTDDGQEILITQNILTESDQMFEAEDESGKKKDTDGIEKFEKNFSKNQKKRSNT